MDGSLAAGGPPDVNGLSTSGKMLAELASIEVLPDFHPDKEQAQYECRCCGAPYAVAAADHDRPEENQSGCERYSGSKIQAQDASGRTAQELSAFIDERGCRPSVLWIKSFCVYHGAKR